MEGEEVKKRLARFYEVYNPSCLSSVDAIWRTYRGREEDIFRVLVDKYGPEPSLHSGMASPTTESHSKPSEGDWLTRFQNFFSYYRPDKVDEIPRALEKYKGREAEWMMELVKKYGEEPLRKSPKLSRRSGNKEIRSLRDRLIDFYQVHNESMIPFVDELIKNYNGNEEEMFKDLDRQYSEKKELMPRAPASYSSDVDGVMKRLSTALEVKTAETLALKNEKGGLVEELSISRRSLEGSREREKLLETQLLAAQEQLLVQEKLLSNAAYRRREEDSRDNALRAEILKAKKDCEDIRSSCGKLEHRVRVLELEKQQLLEELKETERRAFDVSDLLSIERQKNLVLIEEVGKLKLAVERPASESAFSSIVKDIENRLSKHYEGELERYRKEMNEYYLYAENQLRRRDALIAELGSDC
ncbi:hypothetical protein DQ04_01851130 [Trypanosoma grayi]|uniref:hypothetical protein n=1 Tax=Trypanosoma grayi TaxID=71804 RepID=UPI0004F400A6|nr:hypothetical protein DQ04_01851130 [Trypanosoma grayi]KEG12268.1 hypothetical protein DQ04_01851130 [Trypanosoma grayi]